MAKTKQKKLTEAQREELRTLLARRVYQKAAQWDTEREIERVLGREIEHYELLDEVCAVEMNVPATLCQADEMLKFDDEVLNTFLSDNGVN